MSSFPRGQHQVQQADTRAHPRMAVADSVQVVKGDSAPDRARVRLAELVAALSLGVDLGFGQPMEHVLRQCDDLVAPCRNARVGRGRSIRRLLHGPAWSTWVVIPTRTSRPSGSATTSRSSPTSTTTSWEPEWGPGHDAIAGQREPTAAPLPSRRRVRRLWSPRHEQHDRPALGPGSPAR